MASTTINQYQRDGIVRRVVAHKYDRAAKKLAALEDQYAFDAYSTLYTQSEFDFMHSAPNGALQTLQSITVKGPSLYHQFVMTSSRPVFANRTCMVLVDGGPLYDRGLELLKEKRDLKNQQDQATKELTAALSNYRTFEKLMREWPEISKFALECMPAQKNLPVVNTANLNEKFELPPEKIAA